MPKQKKVTITKKEFVDIAAEAMTTMMTASPHVILISEDLAMLSAIIAANMFGNEEEED